MCLRRIQLKDQSRLLTAPQGISEGLSPPSKMRTLLRPKNRQAIRLKALWSLSLLSRKKRSKILSHQCSVLTKTTWQISSESRALTGMTRQVYLYLRNRKKTKKTLLVTLAQIQSSTTCCRVVKLQKSPQVNQRKSHLCKRQPRSTRSRLCRAWLHLTSDSPHCTSRQASSRWRRGS